MNKTLLVLAASLYQVETIQCAKRLGYGVITLDNIPSNPGHLLGDTSYNIDTTDRTAVLEVASRERVDGIIAPCTDVAVPTAAYVSQCLNLPGIPLRSAQIVCGKVAFRRFLGEHGFPVPRHIPITTDSAIPEEDFFLPGSWIIKPECSSGSKGIFIVRSAAEFAARLPETLRFSPTGRAVLERFIDGFQGTCEGILKNGEIALAFFLDRQTVSPPHVTTCGHHMPTRQSQKMQDRLLAALKGIWGLLEIHNGPFDCDFVATDDAVYILEVSPRMGGNSISSLLRRAAGFDIVEYSVLHALNEGPVLPAGCTIQPTAVILLGVNNEGRLYFDKSGAGALTREAWVDSFLMDKQFGDPVSPFINGRHRVGQVFIRGESRDNLEERVLEFKRRLALKAIPC